MREEQQKLVDIELKKIELRSHLLMNIMNKMFLFLFALLISIVAIFFKADVVQYNQFFLYSIVGITLVVCAIAIYSEHSVKAMESDLEALKKRMRIDDE